jgi:hypothetical protein
MTESRKLAECRRIVDFDRELVVYIVKLLGGYVLAAAMICPRFIRDGKTMPLDQAKALRPLSLY